MLYSFAGGQDGAYPFSGVIFDQAGNLYSTTFSGGTAGEGTVFELTPNQDGSWTESVLHSFSGGDGSNSVSSVILDTAGSLYGTTTSGGAADDGTVFKLTPNGDGSWTESVLHSFKGGTDGIYPTAHGSLIFDAAGNLYGATADGGQGSCGVWAPGCGTIFELTPNSDGSWTENVLYRFSGKDGANPDPTLIFDNSGNLYGTTEWGGKVSCTNHYAGCGVVFELTPNANGSWKESVLHRFNGKDAGLPEAELPDVAPPVSRRYTPPVPVPRAAFHTRPVHPPCAQYIPHRVRPRTTFFSRHGFRSWLSSRIRTVSRPTPGTSLRFTASSASKRTVHRARPSGGGLQTRATMRCRCWASNRASFPGRDRSYKAPPRPPC